MRRALGALLCVLMGCAPSATSPPVGRCPWPASFETTADIGEVLDVSLPLEEQVGGRTTVMVESVYDSEPFVFTPPLLGTVVRLEPYEQSLLTLYASPPRGGTFTRTLVLSSLTECVGSKEVVVTVTAKDGRYRVSPTEIDFGAVPKGTAAVRTFSIFNESKGNTLFKVTLQSDVFTLSSGSELSLTVTPGSKADVGVRFAPTDAGAQDATLRISAGADFEQTIALQGVEGGPRLTMSPATIDFGDLPYSPSDNSSLPRSRFAVLTNDGSHPPGSANGGNITLLQAGEPMELPVDAATPVGNFSVRGYWVDGGTWTGTQLLLVPGDSATVRLVPKVSASGMHSDSFQLGGASFIARANGFISPPCSFSAAPERIEVPLDGGETDAGIQNLGSERCYFGDMELIQSAPLFELLETTELIESGGRFPVRVRALAAAFPDAGAALRFSYSSATATQTSWPIVAVP